MNFRAVLLFAVTLAGCLGADSGQLGAQATSMTGGRTSEEMDHSTEIKWGPAPAVFPKGAQFAVIQGDPSVAGALFTVRLRLPSGYIIPPHTHPTDENVTVLKGTFLVGLGEKFSKDGLKTLKVDGFITAPANMAHFAIARGVTEVQVHAIGPFQLTYVHPEDDPRK